MDFLDPKRPAVRPRAKIILEPGHSPLDWANLKNSGQDLSVCFQTESRYVYGDFRAFRN
jgi:hypothetical protein